MATGQISASFDIVLSGDLTGPANFTASRSFTLTSIEATNQAAGASTLDITFAGVRATALGNGATGIGVVQAQSVQGPCGPVGGLAANAACAAGAAVIVTGGAATVSKAVLRCIANPATPITVT